MDEVQQHPAVALHGAAHVAQQDQRPPPGLAPPPRQVDQLAAVAHVGAHRAPQVDRRTAAGGPTLGAVLAELPVEVGQHPLGRRHLFLGELLEVLDVERVTVAVAQRRHPFHAVARLAARVVARRIRFRRRLGFVLGRPGAALLAHGAEVPGRPVAVRPPPEDAERLIEQRQVVDAVDQQAAERVVELRPPPDVHVGERRRDLARAPRLHVEPQPWSSRVKWIRLWRRNDIYSA